MDKAEGPKNLDKAEGPKSLDHGVGSNTWEGWFLGNNYIKWPNVDIQKDKMFDFYKAREISVKSTNFGGKFW